MHASWSFGSPQPVNVASIVLYGPVEAGIGRNVSGWHCRRSSTLNDIDRWRENSYVFQVGRVLCLAFVSEAFFGLVNASN